MVVYYSTYCLFITVMNYRYPLYLDIVGRLSIVILSLFYNSDAFISSDKLIITSLKLLYRH
jgi:hypothetical protein